MGKTKWPPPPPPPPPPAWVTILGWGLLSQFPPFRYFPNFSSLSKHTFTVTYRVYIWQVSPQLSCGDTCQILMWFDESNMYFCKIENFAYGEIDERSFSNPHPWSRARCPKPEFSKTQSWRPTTVLTTRPQRPFRAILGNRTKWVSISRFLRLCVCVICTIAPVPVNESRRTWVNWPVPNQTKTNQMRNWLDIDRGAAAALSINERWPFFLSISK